VVDAGGRPVGIVTSADLILKQDPAVREEPLPAGARAHVEQVKAAGTTAGELMTTPLLTVRPHHTVAQAVRLLHHFRACFRKGSWVGPRWLGEPREPPAGMPRWWSVLTTVPFLLAAHAVAGVASGPVVWWRQSLSRLWVAHSSFHSAAQARRPRRMKPRAPCRSLSWPKTGSTVCLRFA
jgi:CBS domain-containing protein